MQAEIKEAVKSNGHDIVFNSSGRVSCDRRKGGRVKKRRANAITKTAPPTYVSYGTGREEGGSCIHDLISSFCLNENLFFFLEPPRTS